MARKRKTNRRRRRKRSNRNRPTVGGTARSYIGKGAPLFPLKKFARLFYNETLGAITGSLGAVGAVGYTANGLFKPNVAFTGHQPIGFDQMMLIYEHYFVTKCRINVTFNNTSSIPIMCAIILTPDGIVSTNAENTMENGLLVYAPLMKAGVDGSIKTLSYSANIANINGIRSVLMENDYRGTAAANPAEQSYFSVSAWSNFTTANITCEYSLNMVFDAWFTEPRKLTTS